MNIKCVFIGLVFILLCYSFGFSQKITIIVADNCGFVVKRNVGLTAIAVANTNTTIASVQFDVDGTSIGAALTTPPYTVVWTSSSVPNGCHTINATATDSNGNTGLNSVTVSVKN